jgi:hypothetical protein
MYRIFKGSTSYRINLHQQSTNIVVAVESFDEDVAKKLIEAGLKQAGENSGH